MYTKSYCSYCFAAKRLLAQKGLDFEEVPLLGNPEAEKEMRALTNGYTVPQIIIDGRPIGGYTELAALNKAGRLGKS